MTYKEKLKKEWINYNKHLIQQTKEKCPTYTPKTHTLYCSIHKPLSYNKELRCYVPNEDVKNPFYFTIKYNCSPDFIGIYRCKGKEKDLITYAKKIYEECEKDITEEEAKHYLETTLLY